MRKGLSPLIAVVLLISIAVLIASIVSGWFSGLTKDQTRTISNQTEEIVNCVGVVNIDDVYLDFGSNVSRVFIRSTVVTGEEIVGARLLSKDGSQAPNLTQMPIRIGNGEIKLIEFNLTNKITSCSNFSQAIISTKCVSDTFDRRPRGC